MDYDVTYKGKELKLVEDIMDVGYMAESFDAKDINANEVHISRSDEKRGMSLFVSAPFCDADLSALDELLSHIEVDINCYFIFEKLNGDVKEFAKGLKKFEVLEDAEDEFGEMYGVKITSDEFKGILAKALFLISKDGAVFYIDFLKDLEDSFNLERLRAELNRAYVTYTGVGCHG